MPPQAEAYANAFFTRIYIVLRLLMTCLLLLVTSTSIGTASAAYGVGGYCPRAPFTPNIVATKEKAELKVLVPNITSFRQLVDCSDPAHVRGFCIDVFQMALSILTPSPTHSPNMSIHYTCFNFPSSPTTNGSNYNDMVDLVANETFDAVVGDVTLGAHRLSRVDFTHKYMESGVVILAKVAREELSPWSFFGWPFSWRMWCTIMGAFVLTGMLICYLERNDHPEFTQGRMSHRLSNILWFTMEALVLLEREYLKSTVARGVMLAWLFFVVLVNASYTAGLSSLLTVNNISPTTQDVVSLKETGQRIGYRRGSIVKDFLTQRFQISEEQLVPIRMTSDFVSNLTKGPQHGGVAAIVDESPYAKLILSTLSSFTCDFSITGPQLTQEGFGFGFNKERELEAAFSIALMNLTESGCLQELQDRDGLTVDTKCSDLNVPSTKIAWKSSFSLFIPLLVSLSICIAVHYVKRHYLPKRIRPNGDAVIYIQPNVTQRHQDLELELQKYF